MGIHVHGEGERGEKKDAFSPSHKTVLPQVENLFTRDPSNPDFAQGAKTTSFAAGRSKLGFTAHSPRRLTFSHPAPANFGTYPTVDSTPLGISSHGSLGRAGGVPETREPWDVGFGAREESRAPYSKISQNPKRRLALPLKSRNLRRYLLSTFL